MIPVSQAFRKAVRGGVRLWRCRVLIAGETPEKDFKSTDLLSKMKIEGNSSWLSTGMCKLSFTLLSTEYDLRGKTVIPIASLELPDGSFEEVRYGYFTITEQDTQIEKKSTSYTAYDNMMKTYQTYNKDNHIYPCTMGELLDQVCQAIGIENAMAGDYHNKDLIVKEDLYAKINGFTYRDLLKEIAEASGRTCIIGRDGKLYLKLISAPLETMTNAEMRKLKIEPKYGAVNTLNLSRQPQGDDIVFGVGSPAYVPPWANDYAGFGDKFKFKPLDFDGFGIPKSANFKGDLL